MKPCGVIRMSNVEINQAQMGAVRDLLANIRNGAETAMIRAYTAGINSATSLTAKGISEKVTLTQSMVKEFITKTKYKKLGASMVLKSPQIPLIKFQTSSWIPGRHPLGGLTAQIWRDGAPQRLRHAFFAMMPSSGHIGIFMRRSYARLEIDEIKGPFLASVYEKTPGLSENVEQTSADKMMAELARQTDLLLR